MNTHSQRHPTRLLCYLEMMRRRLFLLTLGAFFLPIREGHVSQIHFRGVTLEQLVEQSQLVLVVKPAQPAQRKIEIAIGQDAQGREAPAFVRVLSRYQVEDALSFAGKELVGKTIEVDGAHWQQSLSLHQSYYLKGVSKSPIFQRYEGSRSLAEGEPKDTAFIVFLRRDGGKGFAFAVDGASERLQNRATIEGLLRRPK